MQPKIYKGVEKAPVSPVDIDSCSSVSSSGPKPPAASMSMKVLNGGASNGKLNGSSTIVQETKPEHENTWNTLGQ